MRSTSRSTLSCFWMCQIQSPIHSQIHSPIHSQIHSQIYSQNHSQTNSQIHSPIHSQIHYPLRIRTCLLNSKLSTTCARDKTAINDKNNHSPNIQALKGKPLEKQTHMGVVVIGLAATVVACPFRQSRLVVLRPHGYETPHRTTGQQSRSPTP